MKNLILIIAILTISIGATAQSKSNTKKAKSDTEYIASAMKLDKKQAKSLNKTFLTKYNTTEKKIKGKDLSQEEKKAVYKEMYLWMKAELEKDFSDSEVKEIFTHLKEKKKKEKKN